MIQFISCQTFAGGFDMGATKAGMQMIHKVENLGGFGIPNVDAQRHLLGDQWDWQAVEPNEWDRFDVPLVIGNPPCSGFSVASNTDFRGADSPINRCMWDFVDYTARVMPQIAIFESVVPAYSREDGRKLMQNLRDYLEHLTSASWDLTHVKHDAHAVGGPCTRRRYFWVVHRIPFKLNPATPSRDDLPVWYDAIADLVDMRSDTWDFQPYGNEPATLWATHRVRSVHGTDGMWAPPLTDKKGTRIQKLLEEENWEPGLTYEQVLEERTKRLMGDPGFPWTEEEMAKHVRNKWNSGYFPTKRWRLDKAGHVIYGGAIGNVIHPTLNRRLTHREIARAMGFPDTWLIKPLEEDKGLKDYWGKGITVQAGEWIGHYLRYAIEGGDLSGFPDGKIVGDREWLYDVKPGPKKKEHS